MTFLNSVFAWGLLAAALPLLIHLFSRRKFPRIDFSTLRFLRRLQRQQMRRLHLRQWLLLLLRTLAVLLIVLAFARPALQKSSLSGVLSRSRIGMAIVLDGSASMQARSSAGTCFEAARSVVDSLLTLMNPGDRALLVLARQKPVALLPEPSSSPEALRRALQHAKVWDGTADLSAALTFATDALRSPSSSTDFRNEVYLLSDFASPTELPPPPQGIVPYFVRIAPESGENLSVSDVRVSGEMAEAGQPVDIELTLSNHGQKNRENIYYSIFLNGKRAAEDVVTLPGSSQAKRSLQILPEGSGLQTGMVELADQDLLPADDRAYFCFYIPEHLNVLLVGEASRCRPIRLALAPGPSSRGWLTLDQVERSSWDAAPLAQYQAVVFCDPPNFSGAQASRLHRFVEDGGGLLLFPGSRMDVAAVNRDLLSRLGTPLYGELMARAPSGEAFLIWENPDLEAPLFRGVLRPESQPASPHFGQALRLLGGDADVLIRLTNGVPLLTLSTLGHGRIVLSASSPDAAWSDWASRGIFAPLLHRLVLRLAGGGGERCQSLQVGDDLVIPARSAGITGASLLTPQGEEIRLPAQAQGQTLIYDYSQINTAGNYRLNSRDESFAASANVPPQESVLEAKDLRRAYPQWEAAGVYLAAPDDVVQTVQNSRYGRELWKAGLWMGFVLLLLESLLGSVLGRTGMSAAREEG